MESAEDLDGVMERYHSLLDESDAIEADNHEVNIRKQLKLAELEDKDTLPLEALSGGELKLVQIIRQMLRLPGLLIMDEPDVFLDFENLNGLRDLINAYKGTLLVVTHSRYLLAHCFDRIWHLENGDLQEFDGSFTEYSCSRLQKKIDLRQRFPAGDGDTAVFVECPIVLVLLNQRFRAAPLTAMHLPRIGIVAVLTAHGTPLQKDDEPHAGAVYRAKALRRMKIGIHVRFVRGRYGR
jgi:energy-coupling factor transporter ATP-binding protein EcfA2